MREYSADPAEERVREQFDYRFEDDPVGQSSLREQLVFSRRREPLSEAVHTGLHRSHDPLGLAVTIDGFRRIGQAIARHSKTIALKDGMSQFLRMSRGRSDSVRTMECRSRYRLARRLGGCRTLPLQSEIANDSRGWPPSGTLQCNISDEHFSRGGT